MDFKNIFAEKFSENIGGFFARTTASFWKNLIITLALEKKSQKFVIIASTPEIPTVEIFGRKIGKFY
jgi:hypothetical protein